MRASSRVLTLALLAGLAAAVPGCKSRSSASADAPTDPVVAEVDGERILQSEVDGRLLQRVAQDRLFEMRQQALDELVGERLLAREARARGVTTEELERLEIEGKAPPLTEAEVAHVFERSGLAARGATLDQIRPDIQRTMRERRLAERKAVFIEELRGKAKVSVNLVEPRTEIAVPADAPALGPADAPVTMVEFLDYQCQYCHRVHGVVDQVLSSYAGKVRFVHREFLLGNPRSLPTARAARCAGEQGRFWDYHRRLLSDPAHDDAALRRTAAALGLDQPRFAACVASTRHDAAIERAVAQGRDAGVSGTPTFFINGRRLVGVRPVEDFRRMIDEELKRAG